MNTVLNTRVEQDDLRKIITFPRGIPGMETVHRFYVEPIPGNRFFALLQAAEDRSIGLILVDPMPFFPQYAIHLSADDYTDLQVASPAETLIYTTVTFEEKQMYTNLAAPVLINPAKLRGKQIIMPEMIGQIREPLVVPEA